MAASRSMMDCREEGRLDQTGGHHRDRDHPDRWPQTGRGRCQRAWNRRRSGAFADGRMVSGPIGPGRPGRHRGQVAPVSRAIACSHLGRPWCGPRRCRVRAVRARCRGGLPGSFVLAGLELAFSRSMTTSMPTTARSISSMNPAGASPTPGPGAAAAACVQVVHQIEQPVAVVECAAVPWRAPRRSSRSAPRGRAGMAWYQLGGRSGLRPLEHCSNSRVRWCRPLRRWRVTRDPVTCPARPRLRSSTGGRWLATRPCEVWHGWPAGCCCVISANCPAEVVQLATTGCTWAPSSCVLQPPVTACRSSATASTSKVAPTSPSSHRRARGRARTTEPGQRAPWPSKGTTAGWRRGAGGEPTAQRSWLLRADAAHQQHGVEADVRVQRCRTRGLRQHRTQGCPGRARPPDGQPLRPARGAAAPAAIQGQEQRTQRQCCA